MCIICKLISMIEIWRDIKGYEGLYQVSNIGRVRNSKTGKLLKPFTSKNYLYVKLYKNGVPKVILVHRLVAAAFIPNPNNLPEVDHINRNTADNRVENLRWANRKIQINNSILLKPVLQYTLDGQLVAEYPSVSEAERQTGINHRCISWCCLGKYKTSGDYIWKFKE